MLSVGGGVFLCACVLQLQKECQSARVATGRVGPVRQVQLPTVERCPPSSQFLPTGLARLDSVAVGALVCLFDPIKPLSFRAPCAFSFLWCLHVHDTVSALDSVGCMVLCCACDINAGAAINIPTP